MNVFEFAVGLNTFTRPVNLSGCSTGNQHFLYRLNLIYVIISNTSAVPVALIGFRQN